MQTNLLLIGCFWKVFITHSLCKWSLYTQQCAEHKYINFARFRGTWKRMNQGKTRCWRRRGNKFIQGLNSKLNGQCTNSVSRSTSNLQAKRKHTQTDNCSLRLPRRQRPSFARKRGIKESTRFKGAYITADYVKAIQDERRKLVKARFKAKEQGSEAKVVGRYPYIGELKYDVTNIPEDFK